MMARKTVHEEWLQWRLVVRQRKVSFEYKKKQAFRAKKKQGRASGWKITKKKTLGPKG